MGGRFYLTDFQLGIITASLKEGNLASVCNILSHVAENQFIGNISDPRKEKIFILPISFRPAKILKAGGDGRV
jgi:hypothetical protein